MLENIIVDENNPNYCSIDGVLYTKDKKTLLDIGFDSRDEFHYLWDRYDIS